VSFYKGIGGVTGAMLLGNSAFIAECRDWLRRFGGNVFSQVPFYVSCWAAFRENKDSFVARKSRLTEVVNLLNEHLLTNPSYNSIVDEMVMGEDESFFTEHTGFHHLVRFEPVQPEVPMIHIYVHTDVETAMLANQLAAKNTGITAFRRFMPVPNRSNQCYTELTMVCFMYR
jgi:hypothetical protein